MSGLTARFVDPFSLDPHRQSLPPVLSWPVAQWIPEFPDHFPLTLYIIIIITIIMKESVRVLTVSLLSLLAVSSVVTTNAFTPALRPRVASPTGMRLLASTQEDGATATASKPKTQELGLLTFDLDDTLYPIEPVVKAANGT